MRWAHAGLQCRPKHAVGWMPLCLVHCGLVYESGSISRIGTKSTSRMYKIQAAAVIAVCIRKAVRLKWNAAVGRQNKKQGDHPPLHPKPSQSALAFSHYLRSTGFVNAQPTEWAETKFKVKWISPFWRLLSGHVLLIDKKMEAAADILIR